MEGFVIAIATSIFEFIKTITLVEILLFLLVLERISAPRPVYYRYLENIQERLWNNREVLTQMNEKLYKMEHRDERRFDRMLERENEDRR